MTKRKRTSKSAEDHTPQAIVAFEDSEGSSCTVSGDLSIVKKLAHALPHYHSDITAGPIAVQVDRMSDEEAQAEHAAADEWLAARGVPVPREDAEAAAEESGEQQ